MDVITIFSWKTCEPYMIKYPSPRLAAKNSPMITPTRDRPILTLVVLIRMGMDWGSTTLKKASFFPPPRVWMSVIFSGSTCLNPV